MAGRACKMSASKSEFMTSLGLGDNPTDVAKFQQLWTDICPYWATHFEYPITRVVLKPEYANNASIRKPFKWGYLLPEAVDAVVEQIWINSSGLPRYYYEKGVVSQAKGSNWVIRWILWHICRYRDWRNLKSLRRPESSTARVTKSASHKSRKSSIVSLDGTLSSFGSHCSSATPSSMMSFGQAFESREMWSTAQTHARRASRTSITMQQSSQTVLANDPGVMPPRDFWAVVMQEEGQ